MKPPAFQFYADDFLAGVADMTQAEVGAYILLLCSQWSRGEIPQERERCAMIAKGEVSSFVFGKFPNGKNARLELERQKQADYRAKQSEKGKASAQARFNRGSTVVQPSGQPDTQPEVNSPSPSPSPITFTIPTNTEAPLRDAVSVSGKEKQPRNFTPPTAAEVTAYSAEIGYPLNGEAWCDSYAQKGWQVGKAKMKDWKAAVRNWKANGWTTGAATATPRVGF